MIVEPFDPGMTLSRPYLLRAVYQWVVDNGLTPYIVVNCLDSYIDIPQEFIHDGQVVLNISPGAVKNLQIEEDSIFFHARFSGIPRELSIPVLSIIAIYARENGQGLVFSNDHFPPEFSKKQQAAENKATTRKPVKKPVLKVVK